LALILMPPPWCADERTAKGQSSTPAAQRICEPLGGAQYSQIVHFQRFFMITVTSVEAQNRFGELSDRAQREPVEITRRGRTVAYVVSEPEMQELMSLRRRREEAARWYSGYRRTIAGRAPEVTVAALTDNDINELVHALR
jgi:prevent-host-death family protein